MSFKLFFHQDNAQVMSYNSAFLNNTKLFTQRFYGISIVFLKPLAGFRILEVHETSPNLKSHKIFPLKHSLKGLIYQGSARL